MDNTKEIAISNKAFADLNPLLCGYEKCIGGHSFGPAIRDYWLLHYVKNGRGELFIKNNIYKVEKNSVFIIPPGEVTKYTADIEEPWEYIWVGFNGKFASRFYELEPVINLKTDIFLQMLECGTTNSCREEFLLSKLYMLYFQLFGSSDSVNDYAMQVRDYIDTNYMNNVSVEEIASIVGVERTYLSKIFKRKFNISIQNYLISIRLRHGGELIKKGYNVSQAAYMCGYADAFNFSKMFKKRYGISPSDIKSRDD